MDDRLVDQTGIPRGDEPGAREPIPTGLAAEAQAAAGALQTELAQTRLVLDADQLVSMIAPRARLERSFASLGAYFFTIDGVLMGKKIQGALFAAECMLVFALTERAAQELANAGLRATIEFMQEEYQHREILSPLEEGMAHDVGGRKAPQESRPVYGREAEQRETLSSIMKDAMKNARNWK